MPRKTRTRQSRTRTSRTSRTSPPRSSPVSSLPVRVLRQWGYRRGPHAALAVVPELRIRYRRGTTDEKVIDEVLVRNEYQNRAAGLFVEPDDVWLDIGGNIGAFALLALAAGGRVRSVEPFPANHRLLQANLAANFSARRFDAVCAGVALRGETTMPLYLSNDDKNQYRHTMFIVRNKTRSIDVPVRAFSALLWSSVDGGRINAIKLDAEGLEFPLLEAYGDKLGHLRKLVYEHSFDYDRSVARFYAIIAKLKRSFKVVHHRKIDPRLDKYAFFPRTVTVYCVNPR
jgi:FkbM family methyltransferase